MTIAMAHGVKYSVYLKAFHELVLENDLDVGGFCVPYVATKKTAEFAIYMESYRSDLSPEDLNEGREADGSNTIDLQFYRQDTGAFTINFGGNQHSFSMEIPQLRKHIAFDAKGLSKDTHISAGMRLGNLSMEQKYPYLTKPPFQNS